MKNRYITDIEYKEHTLLLMNPNRCTIFGNNDVERRIRGINFDRVTLSPTKLHTNLSNRRE